MGDERVDLGSLNPKVVVWDLDDTLWHGSIDAGDVRSPRRGATVLVELAERGIVNTVCSNNSLAAGLAALRKLGLDRYLLSPRIAWADKTLLMAEIVDLLQVARNTIVFVDDNPKIRAAVAAEFGVVAVDPTDIEAADLRHWGAQGAGLDRLRHYRILARRRDAEQLAAKPDVSARASRVAFLRGCATEVRCVDVVASAGRIAELSQRSNRLNLTGSRLHSGEVLALAADARYECHAVEVSDRFGTYGLCGFVAVDVTSRRLDHFLWSCRVLNQGVVEYHAELVRDGHGIAIENAALVDFGVAVDWVTRVETAPVARLHASARLSVLLIGGCDLDIAAALLGDAAFSTTVRGLGEVDGVQQYGHSGVCVLAAAHRLTSADLDAGAARLPWIGAVAGPVDLAAHDVVVLSLWVDYCSLTVRRRDDAHAVRVPCYKRIDAEMTPADWDHWVGPSLSRQVVTEQLDFGPPLTADELVDELRTLSATLPEGTRLILLNAAEIDRSHTYEWGERQLARNRRLNAAVRAFTVATPNVSLIDVTEIVTGTEHLVEPDDPTGFHYRRDVYAVIADRLLAEIARAVS